VHEFYRAAPGGVPTQVAFSRSRHYTSLDLDRAKGVVRSCAVSNALSKDGGLAVLYGNLAENSCIVKTSGVDSSILESFLFHFSGPTHVFESQDDAVTGILSGKVVAGAVAVIRYEGPRGGPGIRRCSTPRDLESIAFSPDAAKMSTNTLVSFPLCRVERAGSR